MADVDGKSLARRHGQLKTARATLDSHCQQIAELVLPMLSTFGQSAFTPQQGDKRTTRLMESTAPLALQRYASAVEGFLVPRGDRWSLLTTNNKYLNNSQRVKVFFEEANDLLFGVRYDPRAGFQTQMHGCLTGVGAFGTSGLFVDGMVKDGTRGYSAGTVYTGVPLVQLYVSTGRNGMVDTVHREFRHSARNCVTDFGDKCPEEIRKVADKEPDQEFTLVHIVMPNPGRVHGRPGMQGMAFASYYLWLEKSQIIDRGGYRTLRYAIARGPSAPGEHYGRSAAMTVLPEIQTINVFRKKLLRSQDLALSPPTLIHNEMGVNLDMRPSRVNAGMVSADGKPLAIPFQSGTQFQPAELEMKRIREIINEAFLVNLFQILVERPQQTATETLERAKEKGQLLSPLIGRLQSEFLGAFIESEMDILADYGALPELPPELIEAEGEYSITYKSDIMRALETGDVQAYNRWLQHVGPMAELNPELLEVVDHKSVARDAAEKLGIPSARIRTEAQLEEIRARNEAAKAQLQVMPMAAEMAAIEQTRAQTESIKRTRTAA